MFHVLAKIKFHQISWQNNGLWLYILSLETTHLLLFSCTLHRLCISLLSRGRLLFFPCKDSLSLQKIHPLLWVWLTQDSQKNASWQDGISNSRPHKATAFMSQIRSNKVRNAETFFKPSFPENSKIALCEHTISILVFLLCVFFHFVTVISTILNEERDMSVQSFFY